VSGSIPWVAWKPHGDRLVYLGDSGMATIRAQGGSRPEPLLSGDPQPALWTADDEIFVLRVDSTGHLVLRAVVATTGEQRDVLAEPGGNVQFPDLSPDGRWLAYVHRKGDGRAVELVVRSWPSLEGRRVIATGALSGVAWGADGELLYMDDREYPADPRVMGVRIDATSGSADTPRELFSGVMGGTRPLRSWDVTADGQRFVALTDDPDDVEAVPPATEIHVVLNWFTELRARP